MVGDDPRADVQGAKEAGLTSIGVRTGKFRSAYGEAEADALLDSIADLPAYLGL